MTQPGYAAAASPLSFYSVHSGACVWVPSSVACAMAFDSKICRDRRSASQRRAQHQDSLTWISAATADDQIAFGCLFPARLTWRLNWPLACALGFCQIMALSEATHSPVLWRTAPPAWISADYTGDYHFADSCQYSRPEYSV